MSEPEAFHATVLDGGRGRRQIGLVVVALLVFLGIAVVKPWGQGESPAPTLQPTGAAPASARPSPSQMSPVTVATPPAGSVDPLPVAFRTPAQPEPEAAWVGLHWRRLSADDPMSLLTSVVRGRGGFVAIGWVPHVPATPVWTSADGSQWDPLPFATDSTFWPGSAVVGIMELSNSLVALTEAAEFCGQPCTPTYVLPVVSWTSSEGLAWTPHVLPPEWLASPAGKAPLVAVGAAGVVVATSGEGSRLAVSRDGARWQLLAADAFPAAFTLDDIRGINGGYLAAGRWQAKGGSASGAAATLRSADGMHWPKTPTLLPAAPGSPAAGAAGAVTLVQAQAGVIAVGQAGDLGSAEWWQSSDGRAWTPLAQFGPLGRRPGTAALDDEPNGSLAADGTRMVAVRGGRDSRAWVSGDGDAWRRLGMSGEVPPAQATSIRLLPGGVLMSDGSTTWFGEAVVR